MRVLVGHTYYQLPGGEDNVYRTEAAMLEAKGHSVTRYVRYNSELTHAGRLSQGFSTLWNGEVDRDLRSVVKRDRVEVCHFHNTFPLISPSAFYAAKAAGARVVLTLHNFRLVCPSAVLMREGQVCEECVGKTIPLPGVRHRCYRGSRGASAAAASMLALHRVLGTWERKVDLFIALTEFARGKFIEGGLPAERMIVKPNFISPDPGCGSHTETHALFAGRLSSEKGIQTLIEAWKIIGNRVPLRIIGDGPLASDVRGAAQSIPGIEWLGPQPREQVFLQMKSARMLVVPSTWYEMGPLTVIEGFATGLPAIVSRLGSMGELVRPHQTGLLFEPGSAAGLADSVLWAAANGAEMKRMGAEARAEFERKYTGEKNYDLLIECYRRVLEGTEADTTSGRLTLAVNEYK